MRESKRFLVTCIYALLKTPARGWVLVFILRPTRHTSVLIFHRVMSVSDEKARSRAILVFFGLDPAPPSFRRARPPKPSGADALDVLWA